MPRCTGLYLLDIRAGKLLAHAHSEGDPHTSALPIFGFVHYSAETLQETLDAVQLSETAWLHIAAPGDGCAIALMLDGLPPSAGRRLTRLISAAVAPDSTRKHLKAAMRAACLSYVESPAFLQLLGPEGSVLVGQLQVQEVQRPQKRACCLLPAKQRSEAYSFVDVKAFFGAADEAAAREALEVVCKEAGIVEVVYQGDAVDASAARWLVEQAFR